MTTLTQAFFEQIQYRTSTEYLSTESFRTANGITLGEIYRVERWSIDTLNIENSQVAILDYPSHNDIVGLLGMNILSQFKFNIDQQNGILYLTPK